MRRGGPWLRGTSVLLLAAMMLLSVPAPAQAFNLFQEIRNGARGLVRVSGRVLQAPEKVVTFVTRPLPGDIRQPVRVLGTIALTRKLMKNPKVAEVFRKAQAAQRAGQDLELVAEARRRLRDAYAQQAKDFAAQAKAIEKEIARIKADPQIGDVKRIVSLRQLQENYTQAASKASGRASRVSDADVIKLLAEKSLVPRVLGGAKAVARQKLDEALGGYITPATIERFARGGITPEAMVELIIAGDARTVVTGKGLPDDFVDRLRDALKEQLRNDVDFFKKNWRAELERLVAEIEKEHGTQVAEEGGAGDEGAEDEGFTDADLEPAGYEGETEGYDTDEGTAGGEAAETWVVWYGTDMGWQPIRIWEKSAFKADTPGNSIEGGGLSDEPIRKTKVAEFATQKEAMDFLDGALSNVRTAEGIYAGLLIADFQGETHDIEHIGFDPREYP